MKRNIEISSNRMRRSLTRNISAIRTVVVFTINVIGLSVIRTVCYVDCNFGDFKIAEIR